MAGNRSRTIYDSGYPNSVANVFETGASHRANPGQDIATYPESTVQPTWDPTIGGQGGSNYLNGYTRGISRDWHTNAISNPFTGRSRRFVMRDLNKDRGPVGRTNMRMMLQAGVDQQFQTNYPSLEEIARSLSGA